MSDTEYTPSAGNVRSAWEVYHRECGRLTFEEAGPAFDRWLAAVEAAVRADQIEKDAAIAESIKSSHFPMTMGWAAAERVAAAIRAQQNGDSNAE